MIANSGTAPEYDAIIGKIAELSPDGYYIPVYRHGMDFYRSRVAMAGAQGFERVLDAGHGFGQWSIALAEANKHVIGVDHNKPRCEISQLMKSHFKAANFEVVQKSVYDLDGQFESESFDLIWCWGVIMFVDRERVMRSFHRLLRPGGVLFLGATNTPSRWLYKFAKGVRKGTLSKPFNRNCWRGFTGTGRERGVNAFSISKAGAIGSTYGFVMQQVAYDGEINLSASEPHPFEPDVARLFQNIEICYRKPVAGGAQ